MPETTDFDYLAPDGSHNTVRVALVANEFVFPFLEIARALLHDSADRMAPTCDAAHVRRVKFSNIKYERKCVTLAGLFTATPTSRTDDGSEAASGHAVHFHKWLRAVVRPLLNSEAWPPSSAAILSRQAEHLRACALTLMTEAADLESGVSALTAGSAEPATPAEKDCLYTFTEGDFETALGPRTKKVE